MNNNNNNDHGSRGGQNRYYNDDGGNEATDGIGFGHGYHSRNNPKGREQHPYFMKECYQGYNGHEHYEMNGCDCYGFQREGYNKKCDHDNAVGSNTHNAAPNQATTKSQLAHTIAMSPSVRNKKKRRRQNTKKRFANNRIMNDQISSSKDNLYNSLNNDEAKASPSPAIILSKEQLEKARFVSILTQWVDLKYDEKQKCYKPRYKIISRGESVDSKGEGLLLVTLASIKRLKEEHQQYGGLQFTGDLSALLRDDCAVNDSYVLLLRWIRQSENKLPKETKFNKEFLDNAKALKPNIVTVQGHTHHGSRGNSMGYGFHASYSKIQEEPNMSSVMPYALKNVSNRTAMKQKFMSIPSSKIGGNERKRMELEEIDNRHKETVLDELARAALCINQGCLANARGVAITKSGTYLNRTLKQVAHEVNDELRKNVNLLGSEVPYPAAFVNWNAETDFEHTECDCSYTLIRVPKQEFVPYGEESARATFNFYCLGESEPLRIDLVVGMTVYFSGFLVVHRQERCSCGVGGEKRDLLNISAYGNKAIYCSTRKTVGRNIEFSEEGEEPIALCPKKDGECCAPDNMGAPTAQEQQPEDLRKTNPPLKTRSGRCSVPRKYFPVEGH